LKKKILIYLYRNFSLRYLIDTKLIDKLSQEFEVILLTKDNYVDYYKNFLNKNIKIIGYNWYQFERSRKNKFFNKFLILIRKLSSGKKYSDNKTVRVREIQYKENYKKQKIFFYSCLLISKILNSSLFLRKIFNNLEKLYLNTKFFDNLLNLHKPKAVIIGSCCIDHDAYISVSAKKLNIKLLSIIYSWDNPSTKGSAICKPDRVFSWNKSMTEDIENFFEIKKDKIYECGILHWSNYEKDLPEIVSNQIKTIAFFSSAPSNFENAYDNLIDILNYQNSKRKIRVLARMHPSFFVENKYFNQNLEIQKNILERYGNKISFINPQIISCDNKSDFLMDLKEDLKDIKKILTKSDVIISQYSTILIETLILKKPLINYSTGLFRNTPFTKKEIFSMMHHLNKFLRYKLVADIDNKKSMYKELDKLLDGNINFDNYRKFFLDNISSIKKDNIETIKKELIRFIDN